MKHVSTIKRNKRGKEYSTRSTRNANGIMKHYGNYNVPNHMLRLAVYGTFDPSARQKFDRIWITVMHPDDNSYTKRVMILRKNINKFRHRIPKSERNIIRYVNNQR